MFPCEPKGNKVHDLPQSFLDSTQNTDEGIPLKQLRQEQSMSFSSQIGDSQNMVQKQQYQPHPGIYICPFIGSSSL